MKIGGSRVTYIQHKSLSALLKSMFPLLWPVTNMFRPRNVFYFIKKVLGKGRMFISHCWGSHFSGTGADSRGLSECRRLRTCRKVCAVIRMLPAVILLSSKNRKVWLFHETRKGLYWFVCVWNSSAILSHPCSLTSSNPDTLQKWQFRVVWNHLALTGTKKAADRWQKPFHQLQPAVCVCTPKLPEILGAESLWLHLSIITFSITQEFAVSKFYSLGIMNIIHM